MGEEQECSSVNTMVEMGLNSGTDFPFFFFFSFCKRHKEKRKKMRIGTRAVATVVPSGAINF